MNKAVRAFLSLAVLSLSACAGWEVEPPGVVPVVLPEHSAILPDGYRTHETLHFTLSGANTNVLSSVGETAETVYRKIMFDTNLLSFKPKENYPVYIYRTAEEFQMKTGYPAWSGGGAITQPVGTLSPAERDLRARTTLYLYETNVHAPLLAHEICHLVFNEFMSIETPDDSVRLMWLNEGLATYEEFEQYPQDRRRAFLESIRPALKTWAIPLRELTTFRPMAAPERTLGSLSTDGRTFTYTNIQVWYWQSRSLVEFLIQRHGEYNFFLLLNALNRRKDLVEALNEAYPGRWKGLEELENEWRQSI